MEGGGAMPKPVAGGVGGATDPICISRPTTKIQTHHPSSAQFPAPLSVNRTEPFTTSCIRCSCIGETSTKKMEVTDGREENGADRSRYDHVFGPVPSRIEVEKAIADLKKFILGYSTSGAGFDSLMQMISPYNPGMPQSVGYKRVCDAFHLLQTDPAVQRMVISISSDKAVWDAILKNKAVQDLQESISTAKEEIPQRSKEESDLLTLILKWILGILKSKVVELIQKFGLLALEIFQLTEKDRPTSELGYLLEEKIKSSLLLSIMTLLIVVVTRAIGPDHHF